MKFRTLIMLVAILAALLIVNRASAKSDMYLNYTSENVDGTTVIGFRGVNGAARTSGTPHIGWVSGYTETDCWLSWCGAVEFTQDDQYYYAAWI